MAEERVLVPGEFYKHFKNKLYQIKMVAIHSETGEKMVVYQRMYDDFQVYVRPYDMFMSEVDHVKYPDVKQKYRFEKVEDITTLTNNTETIETIENTNIEIDEETVDPRLMQFLDADSFQDKLNVLASLKAKMDDRLIDDIAMSMDLTVDEGDIEERYKSLRYCIMTKAKYECERLR